MGVSAINAMKTRQETGFSDLLPYQTLISEGVI
jgi:hypothetical protein